MCKLSSQFKTVFGSWPLNSVLLTVLFDFLYPWSLSKLLVFTRCCKIKARTKWIFERVSQLGLSKQFCYTAQLWKVRDFCCIKCYIQCKGYQPYKWTSVWISSSVKRGFPDGFCPVISPSSFWQRLIQILKYGRKGMAKPTCPKIEFPVAHASMEVMGTFCHDWGLDYSLANWSIWTPKWVQKWGWLYRSWQRSGQVLYKIN